MRYVGLVSLVLIVAGCGSANVVFDIQLAASLPDGTPVIEIKPNGQERPEGTGPFGNYVLLVRRNGDGYDTRQFDSTEAAAGVKLDLAMPASEIQEGDALTAAVENIIAGDMDDTVRLSNVLDVPHPPEDGSLACDSQSECELTIGVRHARSQLLSWERAFLD